MRGVCCESEWHVRQFKSFSDVFFAFLCLCGYLCLEWQGTMSDARIFVRHRAFPLVLNPGCPLYPYEVEAHAFFPFTPNFLNFPKFGSFPLELDLLLIRSTFTDKFECNYQQTTFKESYFRTSV